MLLSCEEHIYFLNKYFQGFILFCKETQGFSQVQQAHRVDGHCVKHLCQRCERAEYLVMLVLLSKLTTRCIKAISDLMD